MIPSFLQFCLLGAACLALVALACRSNGDCPGKVCAVLIPTNDGIWTHGDGPRVGVCQDQVYCLAKAFEFAESGESNFTYPNTNFTFKSVICGGEMKDCGASCGCSANRPTCASASNGWLTISGCTTTGFCHKWRRELKDQFTWTCGKERVVAIKLFAVFAPLLVVLLV